LFASDLPRNIFEKISGILNNITIKRQLTSVKCIIKRANIIAAPRAQARK